MALSAKSIKRARAFNKMNNQIGILSRTATKKDQALVAQLQEIVAQFSLAK